MSNNALRLQTNVPETIALEFTDGLAVASKFGGDQIMFSLVDGRKLFVAPFVAGKITASGVQSYEPFEICKRELVNGNRRMVEFQIQREAAPVATNGAGRNGLPPTLRGKVALERGPKRRATSFSRAASSGRSSIRAKQTASPRAKTLDIHGKSLTASGEGLQAR